MCVLGSGEYAVNEARELVSIVGEVTILTNGAALTASAPEGVKVIEGLVSELRGEERLQSVVFTDGSELPVSGAFIAYGTAGSAELAKKLGAFTDGSRIIVSETMATNVPGLFAAGDCTGGMLQVAKAVYQGAEAGTNVVKLLRKG